MLPSALCAKSVRNEVSAVLAVPVVLPKTVFARKPPEVKMPRSKLSKSLLRLLRRYIQPMPSKAIPADPPSTNKSTLPSKPSRNEGSGIGSGCTGAFATGVVFSGALAGVAGLSAVSETGAALPADVAAGTLLSAGATVAAAAG